MKNIGLGEVGNFKYKFTIYRRTDIFKLEEAAQ